jgi:hypothetical protein
VRGRTEYYVPLSEINSKFQWKALNYLSLFNILVLVVRKELIISSNKLICLIVGRTEIDFAFLSDCHFD